MNNSSQHKVPRSYPRWGTRRDEEPVTIHAAELHEQDECIALCDGRAVMPLADRFDPADPAACPMCRSLSA